MNRLTSSDSVVLFVDHQTGLANGIADQSITEYTNNVTALAKLTRLFRIPAILTTSSEDGPNGPTLPCIRTILPDAPIIPRPGQINAWENKDFVSAIEKTGRKRLIIAGISTEVCVAFVGLSAIKAGYDVYAVIDASGTWSKLVQEIAVARMVQAGIKPTTWVAVAAELQQDWRNDTAQEFAKIMGEHLPFYGNVIDSFTAKSAK